MSRPKNCEALPELVEARVNHALAFLRGMILGVFAQIPVRASLQDFLGQLDVHFVFERGDFVLKLLLEIGHSTTKVTL